MSSFSTKLLLLAFFPSIGLPLIQPVSLSYWQLLLNYNKNHEAAHLHIVLAKILIERDSRCCSLLLLLMMEGFPASFESLAACLIANSTCLRFRPKSSNLMITFAAAKPAKPASSERQLQRSKAT